MAAFYVLVLDQNKNDDQYWRASASSTSSEKLQALVCYKDPPHGYPKSVWIAVSAVPLTGAIPPCNDENGSALYGTVYGLEHV